jgi:CRISPR-associated protein Cmr1
MAGRRQIHTVRAAFELVTPAFCGGAEPTGPPETRVPHILGALRFWWRALAWSRTGSGTPSRVDRAFGPEETGARLRQIRDWEAQLFGSSATGQGRFVARELRCEQPDDVLAYERDLRSLIGGYPRRSFPQGDARCPWERDGVGVAYLANQGLVRRDDLVDESGKRAPHTSHEGRHLKGNQDARPSLPPGTLFAVELRGREPLDGGPKLGSPPSIVETLLAFGHLGGIGSRTRRGFGSVRLRELVVDGVARELPSTRDGYRAWLASLLNRGRATEGGTTSAAVPYSAFTRHARIRVVPADPSQDTRALHSEMGFRLLFYRGAGHASGRGRRAGNVPKAEHEQFFWADHDWFTAIADDPDFWNGHVDTGSIVSRAATTPGVGQSAPRRTAFGLPHNYFRQRGRQAVRITPAEADRRASPLLLHLHKFDGEPPMAVWLLLPARFLPEPRDGRVETLRVARASDEEIGDAGHVVWQADLRPVLRFLQGRHLPGVERVTP